MHGRPRRLGALHTVPQRLQHAEIDGGLDGPVVPADSVGFDDHRERDAAGVGGDCDSQALGFQQRRVHASGEIPHRVHRPVGLAAQLPEQRCGSRRFVLLGDSSRQAQLDLERHQPCLGAVVEITLQPASCRVLNLNQAGTPGLTQLLHSGFEALREQLVAQGEPHAGGKLRRQPAVVVPEALGCRR